MGVRRKADLFVDRSMTKGKAMLHQLKPALITFAVLTVVTGIFYPLLVTGFAQIVFPDESNGSKVTFNGTVVGSALIGAPFSDPAYFWGRPSATAGFEYNASLSGGSNLGPGNRNITDRARSRIESLRAADPENDDPIPSDLVTASGSGLDPHISVDAAMYQVPRVARARNMTNETVIELVNRNTDDRQLGILGEKRVNVLMLNIDLDEMEAGIGDENPEPIRIPTIERRVLGLTWSDWLFLIIFFVVVPMAAWAIGAFIYAVMDGPPGWIARTFGWIERRIYKITRVDGKGMSWRMYAFALILFNLIGFLFLFALIMAQGFLPFDPSESPDADQSFNTAVSFVTNTNWQSYAGETTMSHITQMLGLTVQNFLSAATGLSVLIALIRGIRGRSIKDLGNFWVDVTRATLVLLPLAFALAVLLVSQGTPQTFSGPIHATMLEPAVALDGGNVTEQIIPLGPVASQEAIKELGTNGGGFFNANSAHPFENPTPLSNFLEIMALLLIPIGLCFTFGDMVKDKKQGIAILFAMFAIFTAFLAFTIWAEEGGNPALDGLGVDQSIGETHPGGNMEGKEVRFGTVPSCMFAVATTSTSCGAVNSMHDSYTPLGGMAPLVLIQFGEVVFGGVGSGLYGMLIFVIIAVFVSGLMIGRIPEYLGKKVGPFEMAMCTIIILIPIVVVLLGTALAVLIPSGKDAVLNGGPHGFTEMLYAFSSAANNNGSAFAGLSADNPFYNITLAIAMVLGRFPVMVLVLALAGSLARKKIVPASAGSLPTHSSMFVFWLICVIILIGALSYFLTLALGPIVEQLILGS